VKNKKDIMFNDIKPEDYETEWVKSDHYGRFLYYYASRVAPNNPIKAKLLDGEENLWDWITPSDEAFVLTILVNNYFKWTDNSTKYKTSKANAGNHYGSDEGSLSSNSTKSSGKSSTEAESDQSEEEQDSDIDPTDPSAPQKFSAMAMEKPKKASKPNDNKIHHSVWTPLRGVKDMNLGGWNGKGIEFYKHAKLFFVNARKSGGKELEKVARENVFRCLRNQTRADVQRFDDKRKQIIQIQENVALDFLLSDADESEDEGEE